MVRIVWKNKESQVRVKKITREDGWTKDRNRPIPEAEARNSNLYL